MNEKKTEGEHPGVKIYMDGDFNESYETRVKKATGKNMIISKVRYAALQQETAALREENERLKEALKVAYFALNNCKTYLEVFKNEWKEGEEVLYYEIENAKKLTGQ